MVYAGGEGKEYGCRGDLRNKLRWLYLGSLVPLRAADSTSPIPSAGPAYS